MTFCGKKIPYKINNIFLIKQENSTSMKPSLCFVLWLYAWECKYYTKNYFLDVETIFFSLFCVKMHYIKSGLQMSTTYILLCSEVLDILKICTNDHRFLVDSLSAPYWRVEFSSPWNAQNFTSLALLKFFVAIVENDFFFNSIIMCHTSINHLF